MLYLYNNHKLTLRRKTLRNNMPQPEKMLWYYLKGKNIRNYKFRRQYSVGSYILDFYCPELRLAIEIDGDSHFIDSHAVMYDQKREKFLAEQNINVIRFTNSDVAKNIETVMNRILECLPPLTPPILEGE